jgi:hypothetical protein
VSPKRDMSAPDGRDGLSPEDDQKVRLSNMIIARCAAILESVARNGGIVSMETPAHGADPTRLDVYDPRAKGHSTVFHTTPVRYKPRGTTVFRYRKGPKCPSCHHEMLASVSALP